MILWRNDQNNHQILILYGLKNIRSFIDEAAFTKNEIEKHCMLFSFEDKPHYIIITQWVGYYSLYSEFSQPYPYHFINMKMENFNSI